MKNVLLPIAWIICCLAFLAFASNPPVAPITIDAFATNQATLSVPPGGSSSVSTGGVDIIGTRRGLVMNVLSGAGPATVGVAGGSLNFNVTNTSPDSRGTAVVSWDGDANPNVLSPTGLGGVNLTATGNNAIRINVVSATAGTELILDVYTDGSNASRAGIILPTVAASTDFYLDFNLDFAAFLGSGANFASVGAIVMAVTGTEKSCSINLVESAAATPTIPTPTQTDEIIIDNGQAGKADPGDCIRYKVTIQNTGTGAADNTQVTVTPDVLTTLVGGSFKTSPLAFADSYACLGNVGITVPNGTSDLLANDFDDTPAGLTALAETKSTTQGGSVTIAADGGFTYTPPPGFTGTDNFTYTLEDGNEVSGVTATDAGTVTITVSGMIWFVDENQASNGDGRLGSPFNTLPNFVSGAADDPGDNIFLYSSADPYTGGITLLNNQKLIGQGATASLETITGLTPPAHSNALPATNGSRPTIVNATAGGDGIVVASDNTIRGLNLGNCDDFAIDDNGTVGFLKISEVDINTTGSGFRADNGGIPDVTLGSLTSTGGVSAIVLANTTSGTFNVLGNTTVTGTHSGDLISLTATRNSVSLLGTMNTLTASGANQAIEIQNALAGVVISGSSSTISGSSAEEVIIHQGDAGFTYEGLVTNTSGGMIKITGRTGGLVFFSGNLSHNAADVGISIGSTSAGENNSGGTIRFSGASKVLSSSTATAINLSSNTGATIEFRVGGLDISTTSGTGFNATGGGTVNVTGTGNTISTTTGTGLILSSVDAGVNNIAFASVISTSGQVANINTSTGTKTLGRISTSSGATNALTLATAGTVNVGDASSASTLTTDAAHCIFINATTLNLTGMGLDATATTSGRGVNMTGGTVSITGGNLNITTNTGTGFNAVSGGTVSLTGSNNTISSTSATALNVTSTTIGASGLTFQSISSGNNTAAADPTNSIVLNSTGMSGGLTVTGTGSANSGGTIQNCTGDGISLQSTSGTSLGWMNVSSCDGSGIFCDELTGFSFSNCFITENGDLPTVEAGIRLHEIYGTCSMTNTTVEKSFSDNVRHSPSSGTLTNLTITGCTFGPKLPATGGNGYAFVSDGTAAATITISNSTFTGNFASGFLTTVTGTSLTTSFSNCIFTGNNIGVDLGNGPTSDVTYTVTGCNFLNHAGSAMNLVSDANATTAAEYNCTISNNTIGNGTADSGSMNSFGIAGDMRGDVQARISLTNNTIRNTDIEGIFVQSRLDNTMSGGTQTLSLTVRDNTVFTPDDNSAFPFGFLYGVRIESRNATELCLDIAGNTSAGVGGAEHFRVRQRDTSVFRLERFSGDGTNAGTVAAFIAAQNDAGSTASATVATTYTGVADGFCPNP